MEEFYQHRTELLADFIIDLTVTVAEWLGIKGTSFMRSSSLPAEGQKSDRLLSILQHLGADHYISGPSAISYMEMQKSEGIKVEYMAYDYPAYPQLHGDYEPQVSVLDLLFMVGPNADRYIWSKEVPR